MTNSKINSKHINMFIIMIVIAFIISSYIFTPFPKNYSVEVQNPNRKMIALTFDDGPSDYTQTLLDGLNQKGAKATFFVLGKKAVKNASVLKNIVADGHLLGNHTYTHIDMLKTNKGIIKEQIYSTNKVIKEITGTDVKFYRPPYGHYFGNTLNAIDDMIAVKWTNDSIDWKHQDEDYVYNYIVNKAHDGEILLLHDTKQTTVKAALRAIDTLQSQGYSFVRVDELLCRNGDKLAPGIAYRGCKMNKKPTWF